MGWTNEGMGERETNSSLPLSRERPQRRQGGGKDDVIKEH